MKEYLDKILQYDSLTKNEMYNAMKNIIDGNATQSQVGSFLMGLSMKGESKEEISGAAQFMKEKAQFIDLDYENLIDTCGTGGDGKNTFNISTTCAFITSAYLPVVKHGNRSVSSKCGSADVLEYLGVKIDGGNDFIKESMKKVNMCFLFAPKYHLAMKSVVDVRKELSIKTIFNILGPLINPTNLKYQVLGVYDDKLTITMAHVLRDLGVKRAMVINGLDGLDEITITNKTKVSELNDGRIEEYLIDPKDYGIKYASLEDIKGGSVSENAEIILEILNGKKGAKRDIVLLNSAATLYTGGICKSIDEGIYLAEKALDEKVALNKLNGLISISKECF